MRDFSEIVDACVEWTATVLFRPFKPKKWLILASIALLAGSLNLGNLNLQLPSSDTSQQKTEKLASKESALNQKQPPKALKEIGQDFLRKFKNPKFFTLFVTLFAVALALFLFSVWLSCRFKFIFLENVSRNSASIKIPFKQNKKIGDSYFLFSLALFALFLILSGGIIFCSLFTLAKAGVLRNPAALGFLKVFLVCLPFAFALLLLMLVFVFLSWFTYDFVLPVMFKDKIKILQAWKKVMVIFHFRKPALFKYILLRIVLSFCCALTSGVISLISLISFVPLGILAWGVYLVFLILPGWLKIVYLAVIAIIGMPVLLCLLCCLLCVNLPFAVFLRALSLKFIARIEPGYNLFRYVPTAEVA
ncbi:MAG: hypothetical protein WC628_08295 [Candidatus Omnitrophota bacterium]